MEPFAPGSEEAQRDLARRALATALRSPATVADFAVRTPQQALGQLSRNDVAELELTSFAGRPLYLATLNSGRTMLVPLDSRPILTFPNEDIAGVVRAAVAPVPVADIRVLSDYDAYYLDRGREQPLPVLVVRLGDAGRTRYYIDPATARIVGSYASGDWSRRWLYHGLHSLDFPWLYAHRPLWDVVVLTLLCGGTALCVTSLILAWRVVGRTLFASPVSRSRSSRSADDFATEPD